MDPSEKLRTRAPAHNDSQDLSHDLLVIVRTFVHELHPQRGTIFDCSLSSRLEEDLGIDSLARTELILRIEREFHLRLPAASVGAAETIADLLRVVEETHASTPVAGAGPPQNYRSCL